MTKTEYRQYICSLEWKERRKDFIAVFGTHCANCKLPRLFAIIAYDQDLHVHHVSYARIGQETDDDLKALCKRCHEIETFGSSKLHQPPSVSCQNCGNKTFNVIGLVCDNCVLNGDYNFAVQSTTRKVLHDLGLFCYLIEKKKFQKVYG